MTPAEHEAVMRLMSIKPMPIAEREAIVERVTREFPWIPDAIKNTEDDSLLSFVVIVALRKLHEHGLAHAPAFTNEQGGPIFAALLDYVEARGLLPNSFSLAQFEERMRSFCENFAVAYRLPMSIGERKH